MLYLPKLSNSWLSNPLKFSINLRRIKPETITIPSSIIILWIVSFTTLHIFFEHSLNKCIHFKLTHELTLSAQLLRRRSTKCKCTLRLYTICTHTYINYYPSFKLSILPQPYVKLRRKILRAKHFIAKRPNRWP